ncbi:MAG: NOL1/NOP2/sun family putative RNA methylase [Kangiellaceae bacterium]|nr:NOL1/NOP2/sun family putative RNA methylase [Kangiellaceae bacterium]
MSDIQLANGGKISSDYLEHARATFLSAQDEQQFIDFCGRPLRKSIRINRLKFSREQFIEMAKKYVWQIESIPWCQDGFWVDLSNANHELSLGNLPEHIQGLFYIQEASSMLPPEALLNGQVLDAPLVADFAAAPGSKTTQLAAMLDNKGLVMANELSASRLKGLHSNLVRCGILNTCMSHLDGRKIGELIPGQFDYILLDAPCGGEGTVRKDVNALQHWDINRVTDLAEIQKSLIESAYKALRPGGKLVYSTCTLSPEENQQVANHLVETTDAKTDSLADLFTGADKVATQEGYLLVLPHVFDSQGFFISSFSKPENSECVDELRAVYSSPFEKLSNKTALLIKSHFKTHFGVDIEPMGFQLKQRDKEIWIFPEHLSEVDSYLKINRAGMKIANVFPKKIRATHEFVCCFAEKATQQKVELNKLQASLFCQGQNIELEDEQKQYSQLVDGEVILTFQKHGLGVGLNKKGKIKNSLPRELVRDNIRFP